MKTDTLIEHLDSTPGSDSKATVLRRLLTSQVIEKAKFSRLVTFRLLPDIPMVFIIFIP